jgi:sulfite reductase (NADPH) hemoprotein beta-component
MKTFAHQQDAAAVEEAVSHVAYALSDYSYLVAPVPFGQALEKYIVSARRNVFDQVGKVSASAVGQELIEKAYAASKQGQFATLFASSPSSLLQMVPTMYKLSAALLPAVIHVVAREHSDLMAVRQTGFVILNSLNAEETEDMALLAHVASVRANVPFLHVYDGDMAQNDLERRVAQGPRQKFTNSLVTYKKLAELIGLKSAASTSEFRQLVLANSAIKPALASGEEASSDADLYFQVSPETVQKYNAVPAVLEQVIAEVFTGKGYQLFEYFGHPQAEQVLVVMGTASSVVKDAVESLFTNWNAKVGVVSVRLFRPWSTKAFLSVIPATTSKIAVLDRMEDATNVGEPLFMDVLASFQSEEWNDKAIPSIIGGKYAFNSHEQVFDVVTARTLVEQLAAGDLHNGFTVASGHSSEEQLNAKQLVSGYVASTDGFEAPYVKMLLQLFEQRAVIANLVRSTTIWKDQDSESIPLESGEFGFGVHLGILAKRQQLKEKVSSLLKDTAASASLSQRLVDCLDQWVTKQPKHDGLANEIVILLENEQQKRGLVSEVYALKRFFSPLSQWIIGSEEFSRDVGASGVHQVLASGENVNLLILDTEPIHSVSKTHRKRDLGLYAMQYGNAYVASVALYDSYSQVLRALNEADAFDGPSIILAYAPSCEHMEKDTQEAVSTGYWPLYRYNPLLEGVEGEKAFALESPSIKKDLLAFLQRNNQLSLFAKQALTAPSASAVSLTEKYEQIGQTSLEASFQALLNGFSNVPEEKWQVDTKLWVLVGSDNGHAEEFASKFVDEAIGFGLKNVVKSDMNEMSMDSLLEEANDINTFVLFVCSTAGQGEFPSNAKEFWTELSGFSSTLPLQYAVFGLGDSMYWPREDEKHYFCKSPVDLDAKLSELGATRLLQVAKADDQDADGPTTQFDEWKPQFWEQIGIPSEVIQQQSGAGKKKQRTNEEIKRESNYLRGTLAVGLEDRSTKALHPDDTQLTKFHGIYQQDNRDLREQMRLEKQEKAFSFMIRVRVPGGVSTAAQYLMVDELADSHANGNIKLTTRQAYQLQGILKWDLKGVVQGINRALMDSLAACGDVNRNVMSTINPSCSVETHEEIINVARELSAHLSPRTSAYHEIWLDKKMVAGGETKDFEPFYGETYLPRKFKIAIAIPPSNDIDIYANCLGFIAIIENDKLLGFNVTVGGGMGMTHNNKKTYPRVADLMAFCTPDQAKDVAEKVMILQRDFGDRVNRKHARFKYTVEDHGLAWIRSEVETRLGYKLQEARPFHFDSNGDRFGWHKISNGKFCYTMYIEGGRIKDTGDCKLRTGLRELALAFPDVEFQLTGNQNMSLANITNDQIGPIKALMEKHGFGNENYSAMRLNSIACAALPFCGLAFSEAERYLPLLITKIEDILMANGLRDDAIVIRMTGCPNGCGRPYLGEIGFVGRAPGIYNLYLGAGFAGDRLNKLYKEAVDEEQILAELAPIIKDYAENRTQNEKFGDFVIRHGYVKACLAAPLVENRAAGETFHDQ